MMLLQHVVCALQLEHVCAWLYHVLAHVWWNMWPQFSFTASFFQSESRQSVPVSDCACRVEMVTLKLQPKVGNAAKLGCNPISSFILRYTFFNFLFSFASYRIVQILILNCCPTCNSARTFVWFEDAFCTRASVSTCVDSPYCSIVYAITGILV